MSQCDAGVMTPLTAKVKVNEDPVKNSNDYLGGTDYFFAHFKNASTDIYTFHSVLLQSNDR